MSTRALLRWADLTVRFQPLAHQGVQPVTYALDRALAYRATRETRAMLHELAQRIFPVRDDFVRHVSTSIMNDAEYMEQALKARAFNFLDRHGVRFMSGWAIPEDKAADIVRELIGIRDEFVVTKTQFLTEYDKTIQDWIAKHTEWVNIIANSVVSPDYVRARMDFRWQIWACGDAAP